MSKVTSKLQITLPKSIATEYGIKPGDELEFQPAGDVIRLVPHHARRPPFDAETRLRLFDEATARQKRRDAKWKGATNPADRGWTRADLYEGRGRSR